MESITLKLPTSCREFVEITPEENSSACYPRDHLKRSVLQAHAFTGERARAKPVICHTSYFGRRPKTATLLVVPT